MANAAGPHSSSALLCLYHHQSTSDELHQSSKQGKKSICIIKWLFFFLYQAQLVCAALNLEI